MKILCLQVPALHLGYIGCYGNEWIATPALDRLAAEGIVFDQHYADTLGAGRTAWTGRYELPGLHGEPTCSVQPSLLGLLQGQGVVVGQVVTLPGSTGEGTALERSLEEIGTALDRLSDTPRWLLWADLPSLQPPWEVPADFCDRYFQEEERNEPAEEEEEPLTPLLNPPPGLVDVEDYALLARLQNTYAGAVSYLDTGLALLVEELRQRGLLDELLVVLTSERGLALAEHGQVGDLRPWLHDEVIHLPLIVRLPGAAEAGRRVRALTQPVDLYPTLLSAFGVSVPESHGHPLQPLFATEGAEVRQYACAGWRLGEAVEWALRTPDWAYLLPGSAPAGEAAREPRLYVKPDDRWEVNDLRQHHLELAEHLDQTLRAFVAATREPGPLVPPVLREVEESNAREADTPPGATPA